MNWVSSRFQPYPREEECTYIWYVDLRKDKCQWVQEVKGCQLNSFIHYPAFCVCTFGFFARTARYTCSTLLFFWVLYLFTILGSIADNFFCPSLAVMSSVLGLSENIAGVTILAFGNGSPDIFTSIAASEQTQVMMFTELLGAGIFVTTIIAGLVSIISPFRVKPRYFIRDILFYIISVCCVCLVIQDNVIHLYEAGYFFLIYAVFIFTVIKMQSADNKQDARNKHMPTLRDEVAVRAFAENPTNNVSLPPPLPVSRARAFDIRAKLDVAISRELYREGTGFEGTRQTQSDRPKGLFREFIYDVNPINANDWRKSGAMMKSFLVIRAPFMLILQFLIPVVNETAEKRGWSKLLNCLQIAITPVVALALLNLGNVTIGPVPLLAICFACTSTISILTFIFTDTERIPRFHNALAFMGFLTAMLLVYLVAQETMASMATIGYWMLISEAMLGITYLAWGNSLGDLVSNTVIARRGYPRMGHAACFGGPMFNLLIGFGLTYAIAAIDAPNFVIEISTSNLAYGCLAFLFASLLSSLIYLTITGFKARKSYGYMLFTLYGAFFLICFLSERKIIQPIGLDYRPHDPNWP